MENLTNRLKNILRHKERLLYCSLAISINKKPTDQNFPMAVNGDILYYNEKILKDVSDEVLDALFAHEILHVLLEHYKRIKNIPNYDIDKANIAADLAVNSLLTKEQRNLLDSHFNIIIPSKYGLEEKQSLEWYYNKLNQNKTEEIKKDIVKGVNGTNNSKSNNTSNLTNNSFNMKSKETLKSKSKSKSKQKANRDNQLFDEIIHHFINEATINFSEDLKNKLMNQYTQIKNSIGTISDLLEEIISASRIKINYNPENILKNIIARNIGNMDKYKTYNYPNLLIPIYDKNIVLKGKKRRGKYKLAVILDTSASMTRDILQKYVSIVYEFFRKNKKKLIIDIIQNDVDVTKIDMNVSFNKLKNYKIIGRGGTNLINSFEYVRNNYYDLCMVLTDGLTSGKIEPLSIPTTFILTDKENESFLISQLENWKWKNGDIIFINEVVINDSK